MRELADVAVRVIGLVRREVPCVDLAPRGVDGRARSQLAALEKLNHARVRGAEAARQLPRVALVVAPLRRERVLVVGGDGRPILVDTAPHTFGEDLGGVREVADHLERAPLTEGRRAQTVGRDGARDARNGRGVVSQCERGVVVVPETLQLSSPCRRPGSYVGTMGLFSGWTRGPTRGRECYASIAFALRTFSARRTCASR